MAVANSSMKTLFFVMLLCFISGGNSDLVESDCLKVPASQFAGTLRSTLGVVGRVVSTVSKFSGAVTDFRLNNAVTDCLDLMDFSVDQLSWTLAASQNPNGKDNSTGNVIDDMNTWLSGAMANQETCKEGFDATNSAVKGLVSGSLDQLTSSVRSLLSMVKPIPTAPSQGGSGGRKLMTSGQFPDWLKSHDRKLLQAASGVVADAVVAADGTGNFTSIQDAVHAVPESSNRRYVIYIKKGVYKEYVEISKKKWNIMMIGDGMDATVISGNRNFVDGWTTYRTATFAVSGEGFLARDITFENTAGPEKHQAVALRINADLAAVYRCTITGYQDTLYVHSFRQFYRECDIYGTIDYIFGNAAVVFQGCNVISRMPMPGQFTVITAQSRESPDEDTGMSLQNCTILATDDLSSNSSTVRSYLGRPWRNYSRTVYLESYIDDFIAPEGWTNWVGDQGLDTLYYGEYENYGPGSSTDNRVSWPGYHVMDYYDASNFTVSQFITGEEWLDSTSFPYDDGV
ncbi:Pectinesterase/pectinesterase inhibitor PPE8B [Sesamum alatum]|uniref:Pectinesterase n=1 Tax=Sesamum alatum TaxID=300844 RepID=A0AAE2CNK0_9LAMI|nr:Pectinesterase/pectinesterase inhibitor PPE8B [Sesamum alatum]